MTDTATTDLDEAARRAQAQANYDKATIPFYVALGRFLHQYSLLETAMLSVLIGVSGVTPSVGKSIYSGIRVSTAKSYISPIAKFLYRLARKAAGHAEARYGLAELHKRSGSKLPR